ncbi:MAG: TetR/AcrR family transcriptional regulator [Alloacidobacterium sp.]|jgi:AcrR family transcriptional regulator
MKEATTSKRIAEEALQILEEEGEDAVSMRRVAQTVGITPMAIYHHFSNRGALLNFVVDQEFEKFLGYMQTAPKHGSVEAQLLSSMDSYIDYAFDRPRIFDYVFSRPRPNARRYPDDFRARRSPTLNPIADLVAQAMESGYLKRDDVWEIALELWAHAHGYVTLYRGGRFQLSQAEFRALVHRSLRRLIHGLKAK